MRSNLTFMSSFDCDCSVGAIVVVFRVGVVLYQVLYCRWNGGRCAGIRVGSEVKGVWRWVNFLLVSVFVWSRRRRSGRGRASGVK